MGAAEDLAVVRRGYEAFNTGDMETLTEVFDERASWHTPGRGSLAGDHEGRDATFAYFSELAGQTRGTFRAELRYLAGDDDGHVLALHHNSGDRDGKHLDVDCCLVLELKDGRVIDGREHFGELYAWDDFWS
jgi:ketosteroid isomerase-like protein